MLFNAQKAFLKLALGTRLRGQPYGGGASPKLKGEFFPVYVAVGMIALAAGFGIHTARHQLGRSPNVHLKKSRRETVAEVVEPDQVVDDANNFIKKSFFRKVAHVQHDFDSTQPIIPDPIRGDVLAREPKAETLKSVGVNPNMQQH
ncbi:unnamed protein product [Cuscuta europaea]|uniref:Uncharacterized protein n=1 Tax=Cuscuta europaea TaxID=41803 RepID=A0A9P0Z141_CUSEU|nr:unnamed protein product [Cuscuta europaea]